MVAGRRWKCLYCEKFADLMETDFGFTTGDELADWLTFNAPDLASDLVGNSELYETTR